MIIGVALIKYKMKSNPWLPIWDARILKAVKLVVIVHPDHLIPISALLEQFVRFLLVE